MKGFTFTIWLLALLTVNEAKSYDGYQVLQTVPLDERALEQLVPIYRDIKYDFWSVPRQGRSVEIMSAPENLNELKSTLETFGLIPTVLIPDVQETIEREREEIEEIKRIEKRMGKAPNLDRYLEFEEILAYLQEVSTTYPEIATLIDIGNSYEGRPLQVLKLSNGPGKNGIFFDGVMHAREWAGPPVIMYAINQLTENLAVNQDMLEKNDFYFLPVANPDGYVFTWNDTRLWRKTRSPNPGTNCIGTDPNRNFDNHWGEGGEGACNDLYPGPFAFSEPEAKNMADFILANPSITFYCAVHSYGEFLLYPWGWTYELPPNNDELNRVANEASDALEAVRGTTYTVGTASNVLYTSYGTSDDWTYGVGLSLSYTIELPGGGPFGFNPPNSAIGPVTTETWEAIKVFAANIPSELILP